MIKLNFKVNDDLLIGAKRLAPVLGYELGDGIEITAVQGERIGVSLKKGKATVYYRDKVQFFRGIGHITERANKEECFDITEDGFFKTVSTMIDASRCAVTTVKAAKELLDYLAVIGYNMMMMYTEDTLKLENRPYFGYMRGRYTVEELREIDDYAFDYGIEVIPCLECYGHMEKYLFWPEATAIKDTSHVLLAREEKTFKFLDELIGTASSAFRSRRIHIGMDEAWDMGRGTFLDKHGYVKNFDIFNEYMERLIAITDKYGLKPMMWSDMYFRIGNDHNGYYDLDGDVPEEAKKKIPKNVDLVFWHYGEEHHCDDYMLKKHAALGRNTIFAGGNWGWIGHFPEHNYMMSTTRFSLDACRNNNVREAMLTIWTNDNAECDLFSNLFGLSFFAELCYNKDVSDEQLISRFEACTGGSYDAFYKMSYYHNDFENSNDYPNYSRRFLGKPLFWQDIMEGLYDTHLFEKQMSSHYAYVAQEMKAHLGEGRWAYLYEYAYRVFDYMAIKTLIAENLVPAYKEGKREVLEEIRDLLLPTLKEKTAALHNHHRKVWNRNNKVIGWQNMDVRYGGVGARCDSAIMQLDDYLQGRSDCIEELDEERLYKSLSGFIHYSFIATPNLKT